MFRTTPFKLTLHTSPADGHMATQVTSDDEINTIDLALSLSAALAVAVRKPELTTTQREHVARTFLETLGYTADNLTPIPETT